MIPMLIVAVLACAALAYVAAPVRSRAELALPDGDARADEALARKDAAVGALVDIEDERAVGKMSAADFEILQRQYEAEAVKALRELDLIQEGLARDGADDDIEREIAAMRDQLTCPACGALRTEGAPCKACGA